MTTGRDDFDFRSKWAVSIDEMMRYLNELQPTVIHFSGHGGGSPGIYVQDEPGQVVGWQPVADIGWEQEGLVAVAGTEVVGHGRSYAISLLCYPHYRPSQQPFLQL